MEEANKIQDCIKLVKKLSISKIDDNVTAISNLIYDNDDLLNEFLQKVDNRIETSNEDGDFLKCEHNRDGDSYRSPHSNVYYPIIEDGRYPSKALRELEIKLNKMFANYARAYYSTSTISSCYCWDLGKEIEDGFVVAVLVKNIVDLKKEVDKGKWESNNVVNVSFIKHADKIEVLYKLTSSALLEMNFNHKTCGDVNLSGTVSKQVNIIIIN